jgi:hypothetical protein
MQTKGNKGKRSTEESEKEKQINEENKRITNKIQNNDN